MTVADSSPFSLNEPPKSDREMSPEVVRRVLRAQLPRLDLASVEHLGSGWERDVYLVDHRLVVHFPRYAEVAEGLDGLDAILSLVAASVGPAVRVPRITLWGRGGEHFPHRFFGHEVIPGVAADELRPPLSTVLAADLGRALSAIHATSPEAAREIGIGVEEGDLRSAFLNLVAQADRIDRLEEAAPAAVEWMRGPPALPAPYAGSPRFLHGDLSAEHVLADPGTGRLAGIIDWSGAALGDPSLDFSYLLLMHGRAFLDAALAEYRLPVDDGFLQRTIFRARVRGLGWLVDALHRGADPARGLRAVGNAFPG